MDVGGWRRPVEGRSVHPVYARKRNSECFCGRDFGGSTVPRERRRDKSGLFGLYLREQDHTGETLIGNLDTAHGWQVKVGGGGLPGPALAIFIDKFVE